VLVLTNGVNENVYLSGRNLPKVLVLPYSDVSAYHVLWSDVVLIEAPAIGHELAPVADTEAPAKKSSAAKKAPKAPKAPKAEKKAAPAKKAAKAAAPKAKKASKKPAAKKAAKAQAKPKKKKGK
jgi:hypothetical protein